MKCTCALWLLGAAALIAQLNDRPEDRKAILKAIAAANESYARHGVAGAQPWSETGPPHFEVRSIRFVSSNEASVDAVETRIGGMLGISTSAVVLVMKKAGSQWRVDNYPPAQIAAVGNPPLGDPVIAALALSTPALRHYAIVRRIAAGEQLDLVLAYGSPRPAARVGGGYWWLPEDRIGVFLQERAGAARVYQIAVAPGPNNDCAMRVERMTAQDLVLSCTGEKSTAYDNQKFVYDIRARALVKQFSYAPFRTLAVLRGPEFVMSDGSRGMRVGIEPASGELRIAGGVAPTAGPEDAGFAFGPGMRFRLAKEKNRYGSEVPVIVEGRRGTQKTYRLPQSGANPDAAEINEQIGPHQVEGIRLWFGKTFYNGEGLKGTGGFGYFDPTTRTFRLYAPAEMQKWSASAILVEPDAVWLALFHRGEYGNNSGGVLRWDRRSEQVQRIDVGAVVTAIARKRDALYLGAVDGILILRGGSVRSYFVDRTTDGRDRIAARE